MSLTGEASGNWTLHRVVANNGGAGLFSDDVDFVTENTPPASTLGVQAQDFVSSKAPANMAVFVQAVDADGAPVARGGSSSMTITVIEQCTTRGNEITFGGPGEFILGSAELTGVPLQRRIGIRLEKGRYFVRLSGFAGMPVTATELRVYTKAS